MKISLTNSISVCVGVLLMSSAAAFDIPDAALHCLPGAPQTTPSTDFETISDQSMVRHLDTGLVWQRCSVGQHWNGRTCAGTPTEMTWPQAVMHAEQVNGWRLPKTEELMTLVEKCRVKPTINLEVFPETPDSHFWSAEGYPGRNGYAWYVNFRYGFEIWFADHNPLHVRLVRDR